MKLLVESYTEQLARWPRTGRHILAQYDENSIVVYQAYRPAIGHFAAKNGFFGGEFSLHRMSWIKPNFLWMMYRCGWGTKEGQEVILAVRLRRQAFDEILAMAVHSAFIPEIYATEAEWQMAVKNSSVRLQWDPDHTPNGSKLERRAIQLGLKGDVLKSYAQDWVIDIEDISEFVSEQRKYTHSSSYGQLITPREEVYRVSEAGVARRLGINHRDKESFF